ncbi:toll/interleukin-1 receptor domain-containing protein [Georgenia sp. EYE_87]|uniref:toll/interleukin-1 receptor domain-containing protein n=1 Tax=Georgenia sp. EYE_87 TaxID=2853448 RepID=UPI0020069706|nr:toll/interleukin-1 receptor domain-containing protein [Georgenia sp. EYE_87]MCK6211588.1 toll/interleukin-1 receptor domain-containing protein [Georgenia sp. EYE_87]
MTFSAFISYSRRDSEAADLVAEVLEEQGFSVYLDRGRVRGGPFPAQLDHAIAACDVFVVLLSPAAARSQYVNREVHAAADAHRRPILPVQVEPGDLGPLRFLLGPLHRVDLTDRTDEQLDAVVDGAYQAVYAGHQRVEEPGRALRAVGTIIAVVGVVLLFAGMGYLFLLMGEAWNAPPGTGPPAEIPTGFGIFFVGMVVAGIGEGLRRAGRRR